MYLHTYYILEASKSLYVYTYVYRVYMHIIYSYILYPFLLHQWRFALIDRCLFAGLIALWRLLIEGAGKQA